MFFTLDYIGFTAPEESDPKETLHSKRKMDTEDDDDDDNTVLREEVSQYMVVMMIGREKRAVVTMIALQTRNAASENPVRTSLKDSVRK